MRLRIPLVAGYEWRGTPYATVGGLQAAMVREYGAGALTFDDTHAFFRLKASGRTCVFQIQRANANRPNSVISNDHV